jgi:hypothetical protein
LLQITSPDDLCVVFVTVQLPCTFTASVGVGSHVFHSKLHHGVGPMDCVDLPTWGALGLLSWAGSSLLNA